MRSSMSEQLPNMLTTRPAMATLSSSISPAVSPEHQVLLVATHPTRARMLEQMTNMLLDEVTYPVGTLPSEVLQASMMVLNGWSKTDCPTGAKTAELILNRLEREADAGNSILRLCIMHFAVVRIHCRYSVH
jgi:hypothetical protein